MSLYCKLFTGATSSKIIAGPLGYDESALWETLEGPGPYVVFYKPGKSITINSVDFIKEPVVIYPVFDLPADAKDIPNLRADVETIHLALVQDTGGSNYIYSATHFEERLKSYGGALAAHKLDRVKHLLDYVKNQEYWPEPAPAPEV